MLPASFLMGMVPKVVLTKAAIVYHIIMVVVLIHTVGQFIFIVPLNNKFVHIVVFN